MGSTPIRNGSHIAADRPAAELNIEDGDIKSERAKAYFDIEPHLCDCVKMGRIADQLCMDPDRDLYDFAVHRLAEMLEDLMVRYYAKGFEEG